MNHLTHRQALAASLLLAAILTAGFMIVWAIGVIASQIIYNSFARHTVTDQLVFTLDGQPLLQSQDVFAPSYTLVYRTLDGQRIVDDEDLAISDYSNNNYDLPPADSKLLELQGWRWQVVGFLPTRPPAYWYLVTDSQLPPHGYFVGYNPASKQRIGYLGRGGFRTDTPPRDDQFAVAFPLGQQGGYAPINMSAPGDVPRGRLKPPFVYLASDGALVRVDLARQAVESIPIDGQVISVGTYFQPTAVPDDRQATYEQRLVVRLAGELRFFSMDGQPLGTLPLPEATHDQIVELVGTVGDERILISHRKYTDPRQIDWIDPAGNVTRHEQVALYQGYGSRDARAAWILTGLIPMPAVLLSGLVIGAAADPQGEPPTFGTALAEYARLFWPPVTALLIISLAAAALGYRRHRRIDPGDALAWAVFIFLLGPPAWVGYWTHRRWPARARCETCGAVVPRDRAACLACAARFPAPEPRGIEVFA